MRKMTKRSAIITGVAVAAVGLGATAWAAGWGVKGSGSASAEASTIKDLEATATVTGNVFPKAVTAIDVTFENPNDFPVAVNKDSFKLKPESFKVTGNNAEKCKTAISALPITGVIKSLTLVGTVPTVPGKNGTATANANLTVGDDLPEACAGQKFSIDYTFTGVSA